MNITRKVWGTLPDGREVSLYTLKNESGASVSVTDLGGIITSIVMPDKNGVMADVALGYDTPAEYLADGAYIGAMIGRYANRIGDGRFTLDGQEWTLTKNQGENCLHGGSGIHKKLWTAEITDEGLRIGCVCPHLEDGFPGELKISVLCSLSEDNCFTMEMEARADRDTVCCLTNHTYFNLAGGGDIFSHLFHIFADGYTYLKPNRIPDGSIRPVEGTEYDFREPRTLTFDKLDINYALPEGQQRGAVVTEPESGRVLTVFSDLPGLQFYAAGGLKPATGRGGRQYGPNSGFCLEPQYFPDSPNRPEFPSCVLKRGETYRHFIRYEFSTL